MKLCRKCGYNKPADHFNWKKKNVKRQSYCKECHRAATRKAANVDPELHRQRKAVNFVKAVKTAKEFIWNYLNSHPCVDCEHNNPLHLQFDHIEERKECVSTLMHAGRSIKRIQQEIDKCEVRCANCHVEVTQRRANSWRISYGSVAKSG